MAASSSSNTEAFNQQFLNSTLEFKNTFISLRLHDPVKGVVELDSDEDAARESQGQTDGDDDDQGYSGNVQKHWRCSAVHRREQSCPPAVKGGVCELVDHSPSTICTYDSNRCPQSTMMNDYHNNILFQHDYVIGDDVDKDDQGQIYSSRPPWEPRHETHRAFIRPRRNGQRQFGKHDVRNNTAAIPSYDRRHGRQDPYGVDQSPMGDNDKKKNQQYPQRLSPISRDSSSDTRSTVMLRNIPYSMGQTKVLDIIFSQGFESKIDFFYAPLDFSSGNNLGYAFVNLKSPEFVNEFFLKFNNVPLSNLGTSWNVKKLQVCWARVQGFEANVDHYNNSPVIEMPEAFRPIIIYGDDHREERSYHYLRNYESISKQQQDKGMPACVKLLDDNQRQNSGYENGVFYQQEITPETRPVTPSWEGQETVLVGPSNLDTYGTEQGGSPVKRDSRRQHQYRRLQKKPAPLDTDSTSRNGLLKTPGSSRTSQQQQIGRRQITSQYPNGRGGPRRRAYTADFQSVRVSSTPGFGAYSCWSPPSQNPHFRGDL